MEYVNLHYNGAQIGTNVPFQRVPTVGEYVAFQGQWHQVTSVMHDWQAGAPIAGVGIAPAHALTSAPALASDPSHPFPQK